VLAKEYQASFKFE